VRLLQRLSRTTGSGEVISEIDGLRCLAIGAVVLHHITATYLEETERLGAVDLPAEWWEVFGRSRAVAIGYAGHFGVHLFFVISGFILALPFVRSYREDTPRPHLGSYYLRRVVRLEVPYMTAMLVMFGLIVATNSGWRAFVPHLVPTLAYVHGPMFGGASWINGIAWSLEVEVQFYLVMPLLAVIFAVRQAGLRRILIVVAILGGAGLAAAVSRGNWHPALTLSLLNYLHFFLTGFLLADVYQARAAGGFKRRWLWDVMAAASGAAIFAILTRRYELYSLTPFLIGSLYVGLFLGRIGHRFISHRAVAVIGGMCYSIYLYHTVVILLVGRWTLPLARPTRLPGVDILIQSALLVPAILVASAVLFLLVEKPFMDLSRTVSRRFRTATNRATAAPAVALATPAGEP
jgi:peptidoglycan/LPS O-acetylase OafA/YrhL